MATHQLRTLIFNSSSEVKGSRLYLKTSSERNSSLGGLQSGDFGGQDSLSMNLVPSSSYVTDANGSKRPSSRFSLCF